MKDNVFLPQPIRPITQNQVQKQKQKASIGQDFQSVLEKQLTNDVSLKFSKHAQQRLNIRNIKLDKTALERLNSAVAKAAEKGAKESLVLMNDLAFVVSVKNNTVITAIDGESIKENVFTNIDSAVII